MNNYRDRVDYLTLEHCCILQISGSKASLWLGLDSDSDDDQAGDRSDGEKEQLVTVKPHFEGKAGEEVLVCNF